jgi:hypothetical protein
MTQLRRLFDIIMFCMHAQGKAACMCQPPALFDWRQRRKRREPGITAGHEDTQGRVAGECKCRSDKKWRPKAGQLRRIAAHHRTHHPAD